MVSWKLGSLCLLMLISVVLVTLVHPRGSMMAAPMSDFHDPARHSNDE